MEWFPADRNEVYGSRLIRSQVHGNEDPTPEQKDGHESKSQDFSAVHYRSGEQDDQRCLDQRDCKRFMITFRDRHLLKPPAVCPSTTRGTTPDCQLRTAGKRRC